MRGLDRADSWATDGHKWLNVTYDCGIAFVRDPADAPAHVRRRAPATCRRATASRRCTTRRSRRSGPVRSRCGRCCGRSDARRRRPRARGRATRADAIAERLRAGGLTILNDVVLNQVLVRAGDGRRTAALIAAIQADGRIWCGPTQWDGETAMRISVSSWKTDLADAALAADVILELAGALAARESGCAARREGARSQRERSLVPEDRRHRRRLDLGAAQGRDRRRVVVLGRDPDRLVERGSGGGGGAGRAVFQDFHFVSRISKASPALFLACATGQHHKDGHAHRRARRSGEGRHVPAVQAERRARSRAFSTSDAAGGDPPLEQYSLNYSKIELSFFPQDAKGKVGPPINAGFDVKAHKKI